VGYRQAWGCGIALRRESARLRIIQLVYRENCSPRKIPDESHCPLTTACLHRCIIPSIQRRCMRPMLSHRTAPHRTAPHRTAPHRTAPWLLMPMLACARLIIRFDCALTLALGDRHRAESASKVRHHQHRGQMDEKSGRETGTGSNRKSQSAITRTLKRARYSICYTPLIFVLGSTIASHVDDIAVLVAHYNHIEASLRLEESLYHIQRWLKEWRIKANGICAGDIYCIERRVHQEF